MTGGLADLLSFIGRFHPVVVHLPIAFVILAALFYGLSSYKKYKKYRHVVPVFAWLSFISTVVASTLGYCLSLQGDYEKAVLNNHKTAGIWLAGLCGLIALAGYSREKFFILPKWLTSALYGGSVLLVLFVGYQGGTLTYGTDYISTNELFKKPRPIPVKAGDALLFEDVVHPILTRRCKQCHGEGKRKGKLSVMTLASLTKGGESGAAIVPGQPDKSELIRRITLDHDDEDFMPAEGKKPLSKRETAIIQWWVEYGMAEGKKLSDLPDHEKIERQVSAQLGLSVADEAEEGGMTTPVNPEIPPTLDPVLIENLKKKGLMVRVMLQKPVMLDITMLPSSEIKMENFKTELGQVGPHIVWLNLSKNHYSPEDLDILSRMPNLEKLRLEGNPIGDEVIRYLTGLKHLEAVNLNDTKVTLEGVETLKRSGVKRVYASHLH